MANPYCTVAQYQALYDQRTTSELSTDDGAEGEDVSNTQFLLDVAASRLDMVLTNRFPLPLPTVPLGLTYLVAALTIKMSFGRRSDIPKGVQADIDAAEKMLEMLRDGLIGIPGVDRAAMTLAFSGTKDGSSRFNTPSEMLDSSGNTQDSVQGTSLGQLSGW